MTSASGDLLGAPLPPLTAGLPVAVIVRRVHTAVHLLVFVGTAHSRTIEHAFAWRDAAIGLVTGLGAMLVLVGIVLVARSSGPRADKRGRDREHAGDRRSVEVAHERRVWPCTV
jgi:hypothetical protein